ncbi:MAG: universal stress protein [SAR202 cluster bacterium]|nr:universal stress protein [SAR202 cluster bacterium]
MPFPKPFGGSRKAKVGGLPAILVAVTGDPSDLPSVQAACNLLDPEGDLYIVYVIEVSRGLPVDAELAPATAKGEEVLRKVEVVARELRIEPKAGLLQSRKAGLAIVQEAIDKKVDAVIVGIPYRQVYGAFSMGETAQYVLTHAPCRVVLWRETISPATAGRSIR